MTGVVDIPSGAAGLARAGAFARLLRPFNAAMAVAGVGLGAWLGAGAEALAHLPAVALAALAAALVGGGANALNDAHDAAEDRVNRPRRPVAAGAVTVAAARRFGLAASALGVALALGVSLRHGAVAAGAVAALALYTARLKGTPLVGNVVVAGVVALALLFGGWATGQGGAVAAGAAFAFLTTLARELAKDLEDAPGDALAGHRTAPLAWGRPAAAALALGALALALGLLPVPYVAYGFRGLYLLAALPVAAALLHAAAPLVPTPTPEAAGRASTRLKAAMLLGMAALALGAPG